MNYTKGEWKVEETDVRGRYPFVVLGDGVVIARIEDEGNSGTPEANAHLIAAAPQMYEALLAVYEDIHLDLVQGGSNELNIKVQQALAKAERRES